MQNKNLNLQELDALLTGYWLTDLANFSSYIYWNLNYINWAGFYLDTGTKLQLGPFCGKPACTEIAYNRGVCGTAFSQGKSIIVQNVDEFPGHIVCDSASKSEIVIPIILKEKKIGVLDLDSPILRRFNDSDRIILEEAIKILLDKIQWSPKMFNSI